MLPIPVQDGKEKSPAYREHSKIDFTQRDYSRTELTDYIPLCHHHTSKRLTANTDVILDTLNPFCQCKSERTKWIYDLAMVPVPSKRLCGSYIISQAVKKKALDSL